MTTERPDQYRILHEADLREYLAGVAELAAALGGEPRSWTITEVGDGNLNLVFIVKGARGGVAVKQALPYVRLVGESWPLPLSRCCSGRHFSWWSLRLPPRPRCSDSSSRRLTRQRRREPPASRSF